MNITRRHPPQHALPVPNPSPPRRVPGRCHQPGCSPPAPPSSPAASPGPARSHRRSTAPDSSRGSFPFHRAPAIPKGTFWVLRPPQRPQPSLRGEGADAGDPPRKQGCNTWAGATPWPPRSCTPRSDLTPEPPAGAREGRKTFLCALERSTAGSLKPTRTVKEKGVNSLFWSGRPREGWDGALLLAGTGAPRPSSSPHSAPRGPKAQRGHPRTGDGGAPAPGRCLRTPGKGLLRDLPQQQRKTRSSTGGRRLKRGSRCCERERGSFVHSMK